MSWQERSKSSLFDFSHLGDELRTQLSEWSDQLQSDHVRSTLGGEALKALRKDLDGVRRRLDADFTLVVAGDFKRGKSTLINALVGHKVASSNVTPETVTINRFRFGSEPSLVAHLENGAKVPLQPQDIELERLEPVLERVGQKVAFLQAEVNVPWLQGITLVDTPGMGDLLARFDRQVIDYLVQADSVIYVISALSPLSESEERFLRQSLAPHEFPKLTFVVNMLDHTNSAEESERVLARIRERVLKLFPNANIFGLSALDELSRQLGAGRPRPDRLDELEARFQALRTHLEEAILLNRQRIQLDRSCELAGQALERLQQGGQRLLAALQNDQAQLQKALDQCENGNSELHERIAAEKEALSSFVQELGQQSVGWMMEFCDRFDQQVLPALAASEVQRVQRYFPFFLSEVTREALTACVRAHQVSIVERVQQSQSSFQSDFARLGSGSASVGDSLGRQALWSTPWTGQETFQLVMSFTGIGNLLNIVLDKKKQNVQLQQYVERIHESMPKFRLTLQQQVPQIYAELARQIIDELQAGYSQEMAQSVSAIRQAQQLRQQGADQGGQVEGALAEVQQLYAGASHWLEEMQQRLWFDPLRGATPALSP